MDWLALITFIVTTIQQLAPLIAQIIAEIESLINSGQPVPPALQLQLQNLQNQQASAYSSLSNLPAPAVAMHKAVFAQLHKA